MAEGAGLVKTGENGRGLNSRWYPETLARRIEEIARVRERFSFMEADGFEVIRRYADDESAAFFVDPPYTVASRRLYTHWKVDHRNLFAILAKAKSGHARIGAKNTFAIRIDAHPTPIDVRTGSFMAQRNAINRGIFLRVISHPRQKPEAPHGQIGAADEAQDSRF